MAIYLYFGLWIITFDVTAVKCLIDEILKAEKY